MTMIEGIGDEVVQFMIVVLVIAVASLAWWSTNARPDRYRTVLVMRSRPHHPVTVSIRTRPNITNLQINNTPTPINPVAVNNTNSEGESSRDNGVIPLQEMDSIVDADMAMLDNNRLHFYRRVDAPSLSQPSESQRNETDNSDESEPASNAQIREMDSIVSAMEADVTTGCDFFTRSNESNSNKVPSVASGTSDPETSDNGQARKILIKLKYLNDTLKEVEGSLDELLKDFKRRHFSAELSAERRVRLIFRGRALRDEATLAALGLHHRAVVHCLVLARPHQIASLSPYRAHTPFRIVKFFRTEKTHCTILFVWPGNCTKEFVHLVPTPQPNTPEVSLNANNEFITEAPQPERWFDMENILMTLVSVALTIVWFFRCEYSNMFTASASVALFALTVFYSVAIFGLYLSDTFHFDRRPNAPVPNN